MKSCIAIALLLALTACAKGGPKASPKKGKKADVAKVDPLAPATAVIPGVGPAPSEEPPGPIASRPNAPTGDTSENSDFAPDDPAFADPDAVEFVAAALKTVEALEFNIGRPNESPEKTSETIDVPDFAGQQQIVAARSAASLTTPLAPGNAPELENTVATSWDARLFISGHSSGWNLRVLRPESIRFRADGSPDFGADGLNDALSTPYRFAPNGTLGFGQRTTVSMFRWPTVHAAADGANPYRSDKDGYPVHRGPFLTYDVGIIGNTWARSESDLQGNQLGLLYARIIVANPDTPYAEIFGTKVFSQGLAPLMSKLGSAVDARIVAGIEPTVTADGRLIIFHRTDSTGSGATLKYIDDTAYIYHQTGGSALGWSEPKNLGELYSDRDVVLDGVKLGDRFPLAAKPLVWPYATPKENRNVQMAYPWVDFSGRTIFGTYSPIKSNGIRRAMWVANGADTNYQMRTIDDFRLNPDRDLQSRQRFVALGPSGSMWGLQPQSRATIPLLREPNVYAVFMGDIGGRYSEISLADTNEKSDIVSLPMIEYWQLREVTPDGTPWIKPVEMLAVDPVSVQDNAPKAPIATLVGAAHFPEEWLDPQGTKPYNRGSACFRGQCVGFGGGGMIVAPKRAATAQLSRGLTASTWFLADEELLSARSGTVYLAGLGDAFALKLVLSGNSYLPHGVLKVDGTQRFVGSTTAAIRADKWHHLALVASTTDLWLYLDGVEVGHQTYPAGVAALAEFATTDLKLGLVPDSLSTVRPLLWLDEFRMTYGKRPHEAIRRDAGYRTLRVAAETSNLPVGLDSRDVSPHARKAKYTAKEIDLGKRLFGEKRLSKDGQSACTTCHDPAKAYSDAGKTTSIGIGGVTLPRNSPTIFNSSHISRFMADGRAFGSESQVGLPITNIDEMGRARVEDVIPDLVDAPDFDYQTAFIAAGFPQGITAQAIRRSLAAFQDTLRSANSRVDRFLAPGSAVDVLNPSERKGLALFNGKAGCTGCHSGSNFSDDTFHNTGFANFSTTRIENGAAVPVSSDIGRMRITGIEGDRGAFRTPTLRDVSKTSPYMHDGSVQTLEEVVDFYNLGGRFPNGRDPGMMVLGLTAGEKTDLVAFLRALDGEESSTPLVLGPALPSADPALVTTGDAYARRMAFLREALPKLPYAPMSEDFAAKIAGRWARSGTAPLEQWMPQIFLNADYTKGWTDYFFPRLAAPLHAKASHAFELRRVFTAKHKLADLAQSFPWKTDACRAEKKPGTPVVKPDLLCYKTHLEKLYPFFLGRDLLAPDWGTPTQNWHSTVLALIASNTKENGHLLTYSTLSQMIANSNEAHEFVLTTAATALLARALTPAERAAGIAFAKPEDLGKTLMTLKTTDSLYHLSRNWRADSYERLQEYVLRVLWYEVN